MTVPASGERYEAQVCAGPGGVMTVEVGCITGDLTVVTTGLPDGRAWVAIQYRGADEWYTLDGTPLFPPAGQSLAAYHQRVVEAVEAGGESGAPG
ncbi:hypothetical protein HS99_0006125 [Kitasatospora aureofaciens]|uniref:Uncharacterized protein n=1 Tax=Kitasatospora aureofaciens TaxID=1894 RepID=A0A1E7N9J8_KITAU|nr:hypothetical protein HS99_0006125 [Kitasatospora aureofaciens]